MIGLLVISHACFVAINRNIYRLFLNDGLTVELVVPKTLNFPAGTKQADPPMDGDPPINYLTLNSDNPRIYMFEGLIDLLNQKKPRIVVLDNDPVSRMALLVGKWCQKNNARLFCISNENLSLDIISSIKRRGWKSLPAAIVKRLLLQRTKNLVDGVFTINTDGKKIFLEEGYSYVEHMPLGFDPNYFFPDNETRKALRNKLGLNATVIAYFGRLTKEKGIHILIKALEGLRQYNWQLIMDDFNTYASAYNKEIAQALIDAGIRDRVVFINPSHFEIAGYMNAADIVVVPSIAVPHWKEQYGRVAAEALACGRLVIASNSGALPELLNNHGLLFPEGNVSALRALLHSLLTDQTKATELLSSEVIAAYARRNLSLQKQKSIMEASFKSL